MLADRRALVAIPGRAIRNLAAEATTFEAEISSDLQSWNSLQVEIVEIDNHGDGTATYTYRSTFPFGSRTREFLRLKVTTREAKT